LERILKEILAFTVIICVVLAGTQTVHASNTYIVKPNGHDDTASIQAALNMCTKSGPSCTVQLVKGTYYIAQITVYGFEGSFVGMGQGVTIIQALPNLPSPTASLYWTEMPGSSNPWPELFTFVNGTFSISRMTITDPYENPTKGYVFVTSGTSYTALDSAIIITGEQQASASIDHVTVIGASGDAYGTNMFNGIVYAGYLLPPAYNLISGTFSVTNSVFNTVETGPWATDVDGATVTVCYNTAINAPGWTYALGDFYNSKATICGNQGSAFMGLAAIAVYQDFNVPPPTGVSPSTVYVTDNNFQASQGANAVYLSDGYNSLKAVVSGNTLTTDSTCTSTLEGEGWCYNYPTVEWYSSVVASMSLANVVVSQNTIFGGGTGSTKIPANGVYVTGGPGQVTGNTITGSYIGVWLNATTGVQVTGNVIKNSAEYGIALTKGSSDNVITGNLIMKSGVFDLYWDTTGTGNVWKADVCQKSSPPGLCKVH
jgi:parallel beta-helix repeat protein